MSSGAPILPLNGLTVCYMALPTVVGTFFKHILPSQDSDPSNRPELKTDEALAVARSMAEKFTHYPVEDVQRLANTFQPAPWTVRVIRVSIPASTCTSAADYLMAAFGPDELKNLIGGRQWWQLRGNKDGSVEGEWIAMKRDLPRSPSSHPMSPSSSKLSPSPAAAERAASQPKSNEPSTVTTKKSIFGSLRRRHEASNKVSQINDPTPPATAPQTPNIDEENLPHLLPSLDPETSHTAHSNIPSSSSCENEIPSDPYEDDLDKMPCMLYIHGGAYYFGSVNTHRYTVWRYARKMGGRAFAVNYRLAPQYPFPCALADCLAAYIFLIRPPENAKHRMIDPSKIVIAGDSAGGGLSLALLTLIRDIGLPMPAGAVLISPWVDLTHSFPSIMDNADKDIIPPYGFMHQPSVLWPPPALETDVTLKKSSTSKDPSQAQANPSSSQAAPSTPTQSLNPFKLKLSPELKFRDNDTAVIELKDGESVKLNQQIQLYATNDQLTHPYCSPLFSPSLGGLPPLLILAGQNEVLRDEIVYLAHRAAHPDRYPLREDLLNANPERKAKAGQYPPTKVHLQVYDEGFHILPMFSFLRPAKYCYRAIGSFCKFVTSSNPANSPDPPGQSLSSSQDERHGSDEGGSAEAPGSSVNMQASSSTGPSRANPSSTKAIFTSKVTSPPAQLPTPPLSPPLEQSATDSQVNSNLALAVPHASSRAPLSARTLAELQHTIYHALYPHQRPPFVDHMIRERVAVDGKIRPLEDESEIAILKLSPEDIGVIKDGPLRRWAQGRKIWEQKFMGRYKKIQVRREQHIKRSNKRTEEAMKKLASQKSKKKRVGTKSSAASGQPDERESSQPDAASQSGSSVAAGVGGSSHQGTPNEQSNTSVDEATATRLGCPLPDDETPPPSSLAARIDTPEALKLAAVLKQQYHPKHSIRQSLSTSLTQ